MRNASGYPVKNYTTFKPLPPLSPCFRNQHFNRKKISYHLKYRQPSLPLYQLLLQLFSSVEGNKIITVHQYMD